MSKNFFKTLLVTGLLAGCFSLSAYAEDAVVTGSGVNLRSGPGTNYRSIISLDRGTVVNVVDRSNPSWYQVEYDFNSGFISSAYLSVNQADHGGIVVNGNTGTGYVNAMYVRFRSGPGSGYSVLAEYNRGKSLSITGTAGEWTECLIDGQTGYIYSSYVSSGAYVPSQSSSGDVYLSGAAGVENGSGGGDIFLTDPGDVLLRPVTTPAPVPTPSVGTPISPVVTPSPTPAGDVFLPVAPPHPTVSPTESPVQQRSGFINGDSVRFRTGPSTSYSIINTYDKGASVSVTETTGEWTKCVINGQTGYVFSKYITLTDQGSVQLPIASQPPVPTPTPVPTQAPTIETTHTDGYISGNNVRMRSGPSMNSQVLSELFYGNKVTITGTSGDWTAVIYNGTSGYVYSQYVRSGSYSNTVSPDVNGSVAGKQVADFALQFVGYNYRWGGKSPDTGFDCSGLVYYCYQQFGYTLNRVAADQANNGVHVEPSQLQPGDILCFYSSGSYIGHVGIYIGNNQFVHAANSNSGVIISDLSGNYASRGYEARRIIN